MSSSQISIPGAIQAEKFADSADSADSDVSSVCDEAAVSSDESLDSCDFVPELDPASQPSAAAASSSRRRRRRRKSPESQLTRARSLADKFAAEGRPNNSIRQLVRATALAALARGPDSREFAEAYARLAKGYLELKGNLYAQQAAEHAEHAKNILLSLEPPDATAESELKNFLLTSIETFHTLGRSQFLLKRVKECEQSLLKCEKLVSEFCKLSCVTSEQTEEIKLKVFTSLGKISCKLGKPAVSISYFEQAMSACVRLHGRDSEHVVPLLHAVADVEQTRPEFPNHEKAIELCSRAHEIATTAASGSFTHLTSVTSRSLATAYGLCAGAEASAESFLQESLSCLLHLHGPEHPSVCEVKEELAKLMIRSQRQQEGDAILRETLRLKASLFGDFSQEVLDSRRLLGSLAMSQGRLDRALVDMQKAKDIADIIVGHNSRVSKDIAATIETILKHPSMEGKQAGQEMRNRPRFNGHVSKARQVQSGTGVFN